MKKICLLIILALASVNVAQADKVRSDSKKDIVVPKPPKPEQPKADVMNPNWFVKLGGGVLLKSDGSSALPNYNAAFGYQRPFTASGVYWGAEVGSNMVHCNAKDDEYERASIFFGPMIGIKRALDSSKVFDGHLGAGYQHAFFDSEDSDQSNRPYWELGLGMWFKNFLVEVQYQGNVGGSEFSNNVFINIGLKF